MLSQVIPWVSAVLVFCCVAVTSIQPRDLLAEGSHAEPQTATISRSKRLDMLTQQLKQLSRDQPNLVDFFASDIDALSSSVSKTLASRRTADDENSPSTSFLNTEVEADSALQRGHGGGGGGDYSSALAKSECGDASLFHADVIVWNSCNTYRLAKIQCQGTVAQCIFAPMEVTRCGRCGKPTIVSDEANTTPLNWS